LANKHQCPAHGAFIHRFNFTSRAALLGWSEKCYRQSVMYFGVLTGPAVLALWADAIEYARLCILSPYFSSPNKGKSSGASNVQGMPVVCFSTFHHGNSRQGNVHFWPRVLVLSSIQQGLPSWSRSALRAPRVLYRSRIQRGHVVVENHMRPMHAARRQWLA
jgi:hypothetical protein